MPYIIVFRVYILLVHVPLLQCFTKCIHLLCGYFKDILIFFYRYWPLLRCLVISPQGFWRKCVSFELLPQPSGSPFTNSLFSRQLTTLSEKKVLSRTLKGSSAQRSARTFKGFRGNPLEMVLGGTIPEAP